jgi:DnaK suppressor protein
MLDQKQLQEFKQRLLAMQQQLNDLVETGNEAAGTVELDQTRVGRLSRMDALQGQAMSQVAKHRRELELKKIAAALVRIENNEYGECVNCGEEIAPQRLQLDPAISLCIDCANAAES